MPDSGVAATKNRYEYTVFELLGSNTRELLFFFCFTPPPPILSPLLLGTCTWKIAVLKHQYQHYTADFPKPVIPADRNLRIVLVAVFTG